MIKKVKFMHAEGCLWFFRIFREKNFFFLFFKICPIAQRFGFLQICLVINFFHV